MSEELWSRVDSYLGQCVGALDESLAEVLTTNTAAKLPAIDVTPTQGKLLYLFVKMIGARRVLELGMLGGYSTIWMARALPPGGKIVTLELDARHAEVAKRNFEKTGVADRIEVVVGKALDSLELIRASGAPPFDLVFIDADKVNALEYFRSARKLCRPGAIIITDNVIRKGQIVESGNSDPNVVGMRRFIDALRTEEGVEATAVQTVGAKGYDGFVIARLS